MEQSDYYLFHRNINNIIVEDRSSFTRSNKDKYDNKLNNNVPFSNLINDITLNKNITNTNVTNNDINNNIKNNLDNNNRDIANSRISRLSPVNDNTIHIQNDGHVIDFHTNSYKQSISTFNNQRDRYNTQELQPFNKSKYSYQNQNFDINFLNSTGNNSSKIKHSHNQRLQKLGNLPNNSAFPMNNNNNNYLPSQLLPKNTRDL